MSRAVFFPLPAFMLLNKGCEDVRDAFGFGSGPYLVGSSTERPDWRDVDVRTILHDAEYDDLFRDREALWSLICLSVSEYLSRVSGLPVDFQVQRMTEANRDNEGKHRNSLGGSHRRYAGGMTPVPALLNDVEDAPNE